MVQGCKATGGSARKSRGAKMKLAIMQPYFFPYLGYFQGICAVDKYILYDNLAYIKEGWINRNRYLVMHGKPTYFNAQIKMRSSFTKINDIELVEHRAWRQKMLNSIFFNYKPRPFFGEIYPLVELVVNADVALLTDLCALSIRTVCGYLEIPTEMTRDTSKYLALEERLASNEANFQLLFPLVCLQNLERKVIRVIEICHMEGADAFVNAIGGQSLYDKDEFNQNHIDLFFVHTRPYAYPQSTPVFYPHLSIIDVLMNCGKEGTQQLLQQYDLI
jgi:hypothetical protein